MIKEQNEITEQEKLFLTLLFEVDEHGVCRHPEEAKLLAGYHKSTPILPLVRKLNKEIINRGDDYLALHSPIALNGLMNVMNNPTEPGSKIRLQAVIELLDRAGVVKKDKTEISQDAPNYIFVLPSKKPITE